MSLINDVLKDLDRRRGGTPDGTTTPREGPRPVPGRRNRQWPLWLLAALAVGVILHLSLDAPRPSGQSVGANPLTAQASSNAIAQTERRGAGSESLEPVDQQLPQERSETSSSNSQPAVTPDRQQPTSVAQQAGSREERSSTEEVAERGAPEDTEPETDSRRAQTDTDTEAEPDPAATPQPPEAESESGDRPAGEATISIRRADDSAKTSDALADAKRLLARGRLQRAESQLRQLIQSEPGRTEAHALLARALVQRRRPEAAVDVLENGLSQADEPAELADALGRVLLDRGEPTRAREVLEAHAPALSRAPDYHLLLAAACRQAGDHQCAADRYRELTRSLPRRGAAWIGLGASLEALERPTEAADAYNRALDGDDERAARFARQRLDALEPMIGEPE